MTGAGGAAGRRWRSLRAPFQVAVAIGATAVTAATIAIPIVATMTARPTSTETIAIEPAPDSGHESPTPEFAAAEFELASAVGLGAAAEGFMEGSGIYPITWLIPANAPIETMPPADGTDVPCTSEQIMWLAEHAIDPREVTSYEQSVTLRNDATSGSSMTVANLRTDGELSLEGVPLITMHCHRSGAAVEPIFIDMSFDGLPGLWADGVVATDGQIHPPGTIASIDLTAGSMSEVYLTFPRGQGVFEGRVLADVIVGADTRTVVLVDRVWILPDPTSELWFTEGYSATPAGMLPCKTPAGSGLCTPQEAAALAAALLQ